jgi:phosphoenolpyruvate-protein phosphotransferase
MAPSAVKGTEERFMMHRMKGIPASTGFVEGPARLHEHETLVFDNRSITDPEGELRRLESALGTARAQLEGVESSIEVMSGHEESQIFHAQILFLSDPALLQSVRAIVRGEHRNIEAAWMAAVEGYATKLAGLKDEYLRARAADVRDVGLRVLRSLLNLQQIDEAQMSQPAVIVARDLSPSDTVGFNRSLVLAFCTAEGGATSHAAILAKALGIPAVVGLGEALLGISEGTRLVVDGEHGLVIVDPDMETRRAFRQSRILSEARSRVERDHADNPGVTPDGHQVGVFANIGDVAGAHAALEYGAEGVGLLRTEFLYLDRRLAPDEEEQILAYKEIFDAIGPRPIVVRTLDVGGDKELPYVDLGKESNPFLGWRAIRVCLDRPDFFKTQLRALLRASPGHDLRIMLPMIATIEEIRLARAIFEECRAELDALGIPFEREIMVGMMVEVPSVAILADRFAREVDFFSIGTNDLTQYTMAAERTNQKVAHLSDACHPAILFLSQGVISAAHERGIKVGVCGELASDPEAIPILVGMDVDELSMAPSSIPHSKAVIRRWTFAQARELAEACLSLGTAHEVRELVRSRTEKIDGAGSGRDSRSGSAGVGKSVDADQKRGINR